MKNTFLNDHPIVALLMVVAVCDTAIMITKVIKEKDKDVSLISVSFPKKEKSVEEENKAK